MNNHHPDISTLISYSAGSLPDSMALVVACHLESCQHCQQQLAEAESLGSSLLMSSPAPEPLPAELREDILSRLDHEPVQIADVKRDSEQQETSDLPKALHRFTGPSIDLLNWKKLAPGIKQIPLPSAEGKLKLLKIEPGVCMPLHDHSGSELTLVLKGSYTDECGRFCAGDLADLEAGVQHQPVVDTHEPCICLIATDGPLKFSGWVPRILQPFFGL